MTAYDWWTTVFVPALCGERGLTIDEWIVYVHLPIGAVLVSLLGLTFVILWTIDRRESEESPS